MLFRRLLAASMAICLGAFGLPGTVASAAEPEVPGDPTTEADPGAGDVEEPAAVPSAPATTTSSDDTPAPGEGGATAAILPLAVQGVMPDADRDRLTTELVEGLQRGDFGVVTPDEVASVVSDASTCSTTECYKRVASATSATHVVRSVVTLQDRDYAVRVELLDGVTGAPVATTGESCEICGVVDAGNMLATAAATLKTKLDALAQGPAKLGVVSTPPGAQVAIDGELVGTTPFSGPVLPGEHILRVSQEGYITVERQVTFVEGVEEQLKFELEKVPSKLPPRPWGWVSIGVGAAGLGTAVALAVLDDRSIKAGDRCEGDNVDDRANCRQLYDLDFIVLGTAVAGAALTTLGIAILINSSGGKKVKKETGASGETARRSRKRRRRPQFGVGAGSVLIRGRF